MLGRNTLIALTVVIVGLTEIVLVWYITLSPIMFVAFIIATAIFALMFFGALFPSTFLAYFRLLFGPVKLTQGRIAYPDRGILVARLGDEWYATKYYAIVVTMPFSASPNEAEMMKMYVQRLISLVNSLATELTPVTIMYIFAPVPWVKKRIEEKCKVLHMDAELHGERYAHRRATAKVKLELYDSLRKRLYSGEQVFEFFRVVRVTARGATLQGAINEVERRGERIVGLIQGAIPNVKAFPLIGEDFIRFLFFEYGYYPEDVREFREVFEGVLKWSRV